MSQKEMKRKEISIEYTLYQELEIEAKRRGISTEKLVDELLDSNLIRVGLG